MKADEPIDPAIREQARFYPEAEQALLGTILAHNEATGWEFLEPWHFEPVHQAIFELTVSLIRAGKIASPDTLMICLSKLCTPADAEILGQYVRLLAEKALPASHAHSHARRICDLAVCRQSEATPPDPKMAYQDYLQTEHWQQTRRGALRRAGYSCQVCSEKAKLHVHHRTYARLGHELDTDLIVLCAECHELFHANGKLADGGRARLENDGTIP